MELSFVAFQRLEQDINLETILTSPFYFFSIFLKFRLRYKNMPRRGTNSQGNQYTSYGNGDYYYHNDNGKLKFGY